MTVVFAPKKRKPPMGGGGPTDQGSQGRDAVMDKSSPMEGRRPMSSGEEHGGEQDMSDQDISQVVQQHGPAHHVEIEHGEGHHTKTSHHKGAMHKSEHGSAEEAHEAGKQSAGLGMGSGADEQQPSDQQQSMSVPGY